jgi:prepilin-type N-terminal cleavage/methylation domain-containing protein
VKARSGKGFTLFEILIALAVMVVAAAAFLGGILGVLRMSEKINRWTEYGARLEELFFSVERGEFRDDLEVTGESEIRVHAGGGFDGAWYLRADDGGAFRGFDVRSQGE